MMSYEVVVVGGGKAGLAMGHALTGRGLRAGQDFVILDAGDRPGATWSTRWDSLRLFTPAGCSSLPGLRFPGPPERYPTKDDVAAYLRSYVEEMDLRVRHLTRITDVAMIPHDGPGGGIGGGGGAGDGGHVDGGGCLDGFAVTTTSGSLQARRVVVATGPFHVPSVPAVGARLAPHVVQVHSQAYRNPEQLPAGRVLLVGAGNSGVQIAAELAATRDVTIAVGSRLPVLPQRIAGKDLFHWLTRTRVMDIRARSVAGRLLSRRDVLVGSGTRDLARAGVHVAGRLTDVDGTRVTLTGAAPVTVDAVVWATGYRTDHTWLPPQAVGPDGRVRHRYGITPVPGLAVLGQPWQRTRGSALLGWVGHDARWLTRQILPPRPGSKPTC